MSRESGVAMSVDDIASNILSWDIIPISEIEYMLSRLPNISKDSTEYFSEILYEKMKYGFRDPNLRFGNSSNISANGSILEIQSKNKKILSIRIQNQKQLLEWTPNGCNILSIKEIQNANV